MRVQLKCYYSQSESSSSSSVVAGLLVVVVGPGGVFLAALRALASFGLPGSALVALTTSNELVVPSSEELRGVEDFVSLFFISEAATLLAAPDAAVALAASSPSSPQASSMSSEPAAREEALANVEEPLHPNFGVETASSDAVDLPLSMGSEGRALSSSASTAEAESSSMSQLKSSSSSCRIAPGTE